MSPTVTPPEEKQRRRLHPPLASGKARAAVLYKNGAECPEHNQSELTWARKPDCEIATTRKALT